jgi:hypothetical protein
MKKNDKPFDCVEMMRKGALRIHEETIGMTREQRLAYWRQKDEEARKKYPQMRELTRVDSNAK